MDYEVVNIQSSYSIGSILVGKVIIPTENVSYTLTYKTKDGKISTVKDLASDNVFTKKSSSIKNTFITVNDTAIDEDGLIKQANFFQAPKVTINEPLK